MSRDENVKESILNYVENFIDKRDNELRTASGDEASSPETPRVARENIVIKSSETDFPSENLLDSRTSTSTDIEGTEFNLDSDPIIETKESGGQVYKQQVFLRQYQPPTPEPIDIQVREVVIKPQVQRPPIHVYVGPSQQRDEQRTPSPILIKSAPPEPPPETTGPIVYNKYVPIDYQPAPQQIIIHRYPEQPPKPRPIVVEQWLPNKPAPKRVTYHHIDRDEFVEKETQRQRNRFIEYKKPHTTIEVEYVRLPVVTLNPQEYHRQSNQLTRLDNLRSVTQDPNTLQWRI